MTDLTHIKPGDLIALPQTPNRISEATRISHAVYRVTKLTPTQAEAANIDNDTTIRVRLTDGRVIGESYAYAVQATPDVMEQHYAQVVARNRYRAAMRSLADLDGKHLNQLKLSTEQLEALAAAWDRVKAMGAGSPT